MNPPNNPIPLDAAFLRLRGQRATEERLREIVCSVKFQLLEEVHAVRLLGPEMSYHAADPYLPAVLQRYAQGMTLDDVLHFQSSAGRRDLYFEDSWTALFVAQCFAKRSERDSLVLVHLDDHTDMMPTLLCRSENGLIDPTSGASFDPTSAGDWKAAIHSGAVNIGNYITPFYYSGTDLQVRHINNSAAVKRYYVSRSAIAYDLIPGKVFAGLAMSESRLPESAGIYLGGMDPAEVLDGVPHVWTIVHIDLDYFINDFNGASHGADYVPDEALRTRAEAKLERFFGALANARLTIDRWLIATSPGFCCACHWEWLLTRIEAGIQAYESA